jgi:hypothetical protein
MRCEIGDIVLVDKYQYPSGESGSYHFFVIIDAYDNSFDVVSLDYIGFLVSSNMSKSNDVNANFPYNEPIAPDKTNRLPKKSHVKCDRQITINENNIIMKLGNITISQYEKFMELYKCSLGLVKL